MQVSEAIQQKRAIRKFSSQQISKKDQEGILNAGRRSQSSKNTQPWQFIAIEDQAILKKLSKTGLFAGHLAGANLGVAILTPDPAKKATILFDAGQAAAYMQLAAWELGIGSCLASIYKEDKAREILNFPEDWHLKVALSFGYPKSEKRFNAKPKKRGRKDLSKSVRWNQW
jgi:nitroreductase